MITGILELKREIGDILHNHIPERFTKRIAAREATLRPLRAVYARLEQKLRSLQKHNEEAKANDTINQAYEVFARPLERAALTQLVNTGPSATLPERAFDDSPGIAHPNLVKLFAEGSPSAGSAEELAREIVAPPLPKGTPEDEESELEFHKEVKRVATLIQAHTDAKVAEAVKLQAKEIGHQMGLAYLANKRADELAEALKRARGKLNYIAVQGGLNHPGFNMVAKMNAEDAIKAIDKVLGASHG